jgi:hypothetical protein
MDFLFVSTPTCLEVGKRSYLQMLITKVKITMGRAVAATRRFSSTLDNFTINSAGFALSLGCHTAGLSVLV